MSVGLGREVQSFVDVRIRIWIGWEEASETKGAERPGLLLCREEETN